VRVLEFPVVVEREGRRAPRRHLDPSAELLHILVLPDLER
jgi:hypothetical protein